MKTKIWNFLKDNPAMAADIDQRLRRELLPDDVETDPKDSEAIDSNPQVEPETVEIS